MKTSRMWLIIKAVLAALLILVVYRIFEKITRPESLFLALHLAFLSLLITWIVGMAVAMSRVDATSDHSAEVVNRVESRALVFAICVVALGFLTVSGARVLAGKPTSVLVLWDTGRGAFAQAFAATAAFALLMGLPAMYLRRVVPVRDPFFFPLAAMLTGIGAVVIYRLAPDIAVVRGKAVFEQLFWGHLQSVAVAVLVMTAALSYFTPARVDSLTRKKYIYVWASVALIILTALFGVEYHGRKLSISLGLMNFQAVELVKVMALLFMVGYFRYEGPYIQAGQNLFGLPRGRYLMPYLTMWVLTLLPIFFQKDLGPTALIFVLFMVVFYLGTGSLFSVAFGIAGMLAIGVAAYAAGYPTMVKTRVDMWLDPFHHSQNLAESLWAVSEGGWLGVGAGRGFGHYIPVVQSDFNFAVIAEEWGILGAAAVLAVLGLLIFRIFKYARVTSQAHIQLLLAGLGTLWLIQVAVIVGGNIGLIPLTGITLPFISHGGSALLMNFVMLAMVLRLAVPEGAS